VPAVIILAVFALSLSGMKYSAVSREPDIPVAPAPNPVAAIPEPAPAPPPPTPAPVAVAAEPVRFTNPFDRSEVFDFPAGTSREEARTAVAAILLERARSRGDSSR
jgi:hypothetical protein